MSRHNNHPTMSLADVRARINAEWESGSTNVVDLTLMEKALAKLEYRAEYNRRPEVKAKRREYNRTQKNNLKAGRQLIAQLLRERAVEVNSAKEGNTTESEQE